MDSNIPTRGPDVPPILRTEETRFVSLPGYDFSANYVDVSNPEGGDPLRMHYVDEGPRDAPVILMAHGEPSWSYVYRKLIPVFVDAGFRAIAPDHIGFGRSDKLTQPSAYTFERHVGWFREVVVALDLAEITLVSQDWGGPIGLAVLAQETDRFARSVAGNTMLHTAEAYLEGRIEIANHAANETDQTVASFLLNWMFLTHRIPGFEASMAVHGATAREVSAEVAAAYDAPFPTDWHKAGMRQFPILIPVTPQDPGAVINRKTWGVLEKFDRPFLTLFGDSDPPTRGWDQIFQERIPGAKGQPHRTLQKAGHFWQEDCGEEAAQLIVDWIRSTA